MLLSSDNQRSDKYIVLVIYDIIDNRRRQKLAKMLKGYGFRIQKSAFECSLSIGKFNKLVNQINEFAIEEDLIRVYRLHSNMEIKTWGDVTSIEEEDFIFY
jgi:CRISPR-associated protein Cas2